MDKRTNGIVIGIVTSLEDEEGIGRVKVKYPNWEDQSSDWARIAAPMAGKNRGAFFRPEPDDEVLVAFEQGDPRRPYIIGALWSTEDKPPPDDGKPKDNNWRFIQSRSGHKIILDDTSGKEQIVFVDKDGSRKIIIDSGNKNIQIICGQGSIEIQDSGQIDVKGMNITVEAQGTLDLKATGNLTVKGAQVSISGDLVNIN